ncbi:hypothetical protein LEP1GSC108_0208 [Leptospira weilii str. UI 13098]|uniref:Uncharacterized protein n=1 Tax=Leptospira weilii str. UI 13098 TaxID=1088542 RepID=M6Q617_9LEPT|nr:hypothetical protein LEP1GSC108_0187 [Leptospira weilii str. UI 13098]EMN89386.1 hypothetical protein LEP1GSC108_0208 [Leptospira weilii str. UI 13098]
MFFLNSSSYCVLRAMLYPFLTCTTVSTHSGEVQILEKYPAGSEL